MALSPLNQRRWRNFTANRRAYWSLWIFAILFGISLLAEFVANDKPILVSYRGEYYTPIFNFYPETAFGGDVTSADTGTMCRAILALGEQDMDPAGLVPPAGLAILGASGDHLLVNCGKRRLQVGTEVRFAVNYSALIRAMTSPFVAKAMARGRKARPSLNLA